MKRIVCIALSALLCCVGTAEAEKQQLHNDKGVVSAKTDAQTERMKAASDGFHITPAATPDHVIGQGGPLVMDRLMCLMLCTVLKVNHGCDALH